MNYTRRRTYLLQVWLSTDERRQLRGAARRRRMPVSAWVREACTAQATAEAVAAAPPASGDAERA